LGKSVNVTEMLFKSLKGSWSFMSIISFRLLLAHHACFIQTLIYRCYVGLGWAGLGWAGLGWAGLGWAGLGWAGLGWAGLGWAGLGFINIIIDNTLGQLSFSTWTFGRVSWHPFLAAFREFFQVSPLTED
jgi:Chorion protein